MHRGVIAVMLWSRRRKNLRMQRAKRARLTKLLRLQQRNTKALQAARASAHRSRMRASPLKRKARQQRGTARPRSRRVRKQTGATQLQSRRKTSPASKRRARNLLPTDKKRGRTTLHTCVFIAIACKLLIQSLPRVQCYVAWREEANQFNVSGRPLEAMGWKKCSGCMR